MASWFRASGHACQCHKLMNDARFLMNGGTLFIKRRQLRTHSIEVASVLVVLLARFPGTLTLKSPYFSGGREFSNNQPRRSRFSNHNNAVLEYYSRCCDEETICNKIIIVTTPPSLKEIE